MTRVEDCHSYDRQATVSKQPVGAILSQQPASPISVLSLKCTVLLNRTDPPFLVCPDKMATMHQPKSNEGQADHNLRLSQAGHHLRTKLDKTTILTEHLRHLRGTSEDRTPFHIRCHHGNNVFLCSVGVDLSESYRHWQYCSTAYHCFLTCSSHLTYIYKYNQYIWKTIVEKIENKCSSVVFLNPILAFTHAPPNHQLDVGLQSVVNLSN